MASSPSPGRTASLTTVDAISADDVWAAGNYDAGNTFQPLVEHWDGTTWTIRTGSLASNATIQSIAARDSADVWVAGASSQGNGDDWLIEHWDGTRWLQLAPGHGSTGIVNAVIELRESVWAICTYRPNGCGPDWGLIKRWDGTSWTYVASPHDGGVL